MCIFFVLADPGTLYLQRPGGSLSCSAREAAASRIESHYYASQLNGDEDTEHTNGDATIALLSFQVLTVCNMFGIPGILSLFFGIPFFNLLSLF